jgi:serine/threonine protein kinase
MPRDHAPHRPNDATGSDPSVSSDNAGGASRGGTYFLGRYRVVDEIGVGGMASVHLARMDGPGGFQKWVAIKRIHPHLVEDEGFVHMFLDEARIAARISHPNVAQVFDLGKHEDTYWIAMEYLHGEPLREVMRRTEELGQPMPPEIACRVIADAAEGLHSAHELLGKNGEKLGLVHRDVTPHNLFVTYDGSTKVVDFGIAKFSSRMASTRAGTLKGKLAYMSPEQVAGEQVDRRTDVFALGVVLWELTTGQRLFRMDSDLDTLAKVQECNVPRPTSVVKGYPIDLEKIVLKTLAKNKNERYKTARELSRALQALLMKRGLFIASDEVAGYTQSIFSDRIRKREEHLRWAAEVTQTINIDAKLAAQSAAGWNAPEPSLVTYDSDVKPSAGTLRAIPRPAAGSPASSPPPPQAHAISQPSSPTKPRPTTLTAAAVPERLRARQAEAARVPPPPTAPAAARAEPLSDEPPTLARPTSDSRRRDPSIDPTDDLPTMRATSKDRAAALAGAPISDDFGDDSDDTIVSGTRPEGVDGPAVSAPRPAAGKPPPPPDANPPVSVPPRLAPPRARTMPPLPAVVVPKDEILQTEEEADETATQVQDSKAFRPMLQRSPSVSNEFPNPQPVMATHAASDVQRLFAPPPRDQQRTVTIAKLRRQFPRWWIYVAASAFGAIDVVIFFAIVLRMTAPQPLRAVASHDPPAASQVVPAGPFSSARAAFASSLDRPPQPPPSASAAPAPSSVPSSAPSSGAAPAPTSAPPAPTAAVPPTGYGSLSVSCFPACDQVLDNGVPLGASPFFGRRVAVGPRRLTCVWATAPTHKVVSAIVVADQETRIRVNQN